MSHDTSTPSCPVAYLTPTLAKKAAYRVRQRGLGRPKPQRCKRCGLWHLSVRPQGHIGEGMRRIEAIITFGLAGLIIGQLILWTIGTGR